MIGGPAQRRVAGTAVIAMTIPASPLRRRAALRALLCACAAAVLPAACARSDARDAAEQQLSSARLSLTFTRVGAGEGLRFDAEGHFVRFASSDADHVPAILGLADDDALAPDTCRLVDSAAALDRALVAARDTLPVRLLDAGRLQVRGITDATVLSPRHYPELTPYVTGIVYGNEDPLPLALDVGATYEVSGGGGEDIGPFVAQVTAPRAFATLEPAAAYRHGTDLELRWSGEAEPGAQLTITVSWSARGTSREVRCLVRDDGAFAVPREYLASLPAPAQLLSAEVATVRTRQAAVSAPGAEKGQLRIALRDVIPLPVSPWTATPVAAPPASALDER